MSEFINVISQIKPANGADFPIADVNDLKGGYIQVETMEEMYEFLNTNKLKNGMLCYVNQDTEYKMYQYKNGVWNPWVVEGGGGGGAAYIKVVDKMEDLDDIDNKIKGQLVFVNEIKDIRYYDGENWNSFSKIYIQPTEPDDKGGIWIDTSEQREHNSSSTIIQDLLGVISILTEKVNKLEFMVRDQLDFGSFSDNKTNDFLGQEGLNPEENRYENATSVEEDNAQQQENINNGYIDVEPDSFEYAGHLCIKSGKYSEMLAHKDEFNAKELLFCYDTNQLWIKHPTTFKLVQIGSGGDTPQPPIDDDMEGILTELIGGNTKIVGIEMSDMSNKDESYLIQIKDGALDVHNKVLDKNVLAGNTQVASIDGFYSTLYFPITPADVGSTSSPKIYINSIYCGGKSNDKDYNPVSHNFVELCNLGKKDLNLKGLYLHYTQKNTGEWVSLPLYGTIKSQGTFLIKGAQCSVLDTNTTLIKVGDADMIWSKDKTYNSDRLDIDEDISAGVQADTIWNDDLIMFDHNCSFMITGADSDDYFSNNILTSNAPWSKTNGVIKWYVDCVGIGKYNDITMPAEGSAFPTNGPNILIHRYYDMDMVAQATKSIGYRNNSKYMTYIDMENLNPKINISKYRPRSSKEFKNIFFDKDLLIDGSPNIITCSLGYNAHTTRCFTWVSKGYYDEYLKIWKDGETEDNAITYESFKSGDGRSSVNHRDSYIYDRIRSITTDGTSFTTHKLIIDLDEPATEQKYFYKVGKNGAWSDDRSFVLRGRDYCISNGFNFMHFSDQQGFITEEYETQRVATEFLYNDDNTFDFVINTGDITQNGNRINEWLNYFKNSDIIFKEKEQMVTIGNNDLCPVDVYKLGFGDQVDKTNPINSMFFFTSEYPNGIPTSNAGVYVPCVYTFVYGDTAFLSMNSEITELARTDIFLDSDGVNIYDRIKDWCDNEVSVINNDSKIKWKIAYCHESPFTIITADLIMSYVKDGVVDSTIKRGGSHLNTVGNYWFSQFLQNNDFKLCLCGHKHTYSNTRYLREDPDKTMSPIVYEPLLAEADWYKALPDREKNCCQLSDDNSVNYVRYVMAQACGYKLVSNKEMPGQNIPWELEYYPVATQVENATTNKATTTINPEQLYPNYIIWNIGTGTESEIPSEVKTSRDRILGKSYKIKLSSDTTNPWNYSYNVPINYTDLEKTGGNGSSNPNNNIIIEKEL